MDMIKWFSAAVTDAADALFDVNHRLALTNRLKAIERSETLKARDAYVKLGRYMAEHLPEDAPAELRALSAEAEKAEEHIRLVRSHMEDMRGQAAQAETCTVSPEELREAVEAITAQKAAEAACEEEAVAPAAEPVQETAPAEAEETPTEEAAEDENDSIPFI